MALYFKEIKMKGMITMVAKRAISGLVALSLISCNVASIMPMDSFNSSFITVSADESMAFESGTGTKEDPYIIANGEQFAKIADYNSSCFKLSSDISLSSSYYRIDEFKGHLDGDNHIIKTDAGLFDYNYGTISNCIINYAGTSAGGYNFGTICNMNIEGEINGCTTLTARVNASKAYKCGGICGSNSCGKIVKCQNNITFYNDSYLNFEPTSTVFIMIGGIVGDNFGEIDKCLNYGNIDFSNNRPVR